LTKPKNPLFGFSARGTIGKVLTFRTRTNQTIAETKPIPTDARTSDQLAWRTMYQLATDLWHQLSPSEQATWRTMGVRHKLTGYAMFMSQALRPNPGIYLPLAGGTMDGEIDMGFYDLLNPGPNTLLHLYQLSTYLYPTNAGWYTTITGSASVAQLPIYISIASGATTLSSAAAYTHPIGTAPQFQAINWTWPFRLFLKNFGITLNDPANENAWLHLIQTTTFPIADLTAAGIGLKVKYKDADHTRELYLCSHDGVTYSEQDADLNMVSDRFYPTELIWTPGTSIQLYIDLALRATKTTNLPAGTGGPARFGIAFKRGAGSATHAYDGPKISYPVLVGEF
jgi:hypothetical protein